MDPTLVTIKVEDHYRNVVREKKKDKYRTVPCRRSISNL